MPPRKPIEFRVDEKTGCFIITSHRGDVRITRGNKRINIPRLIYEELFGLIPEGMNVFRTCRNERCICPEHMELRPAGQTTPEPIDFDIDPVTGCFNCTSHKPNDEGYPVIVRGEAMKMHRFVYEEMFGEIPEGLVVRHKCDNRRCINPEHLELGTKKDNANDMVERDRQAKGSRVANAKLTEDTVREIKLRLAKGEGLRHIARIYGVWHKTISDIKYGITWKHVD